MKKLAPYNASQIEEEMLKFWQDKQVFQKSLDKTKDGKPFSFYDGPPFANGLPHFGHSLVTSIKDSIGRFQTMRGRYVERRNGWDCHGLPVEFEIEKKFDVSGKREITELGIDKFNQACRESVFTYKQDWEGFFDRIGRWTDKDNAYATINTSYTESVWWVFSQIYKKGLIYKGFKCMPYCPRCATPLSNFELNEGYKDDVTDPSVYVKFRLFDDRDMDTEDLLELDPKYIKADANEAEDMLQNLKKKLEDEPKTYLLAWTTTPWSLPGNAALAVKPGEKYVKVRVSDENGKAELLILAEKRLSVLDEQTFEVVERLSAKDLDTLSYEPLFDLQNVSLNDNTYQVWLSDVVSIEDGTGILHVAPAFGEDDLELGQKHNFPVLSTITPEGKVKDGIGLDKFAGKFFKGADKPIIEHLTEQGNIFAAESFKHTYPFCYRCDTPLLYYAIDTWFVAVSQIKDQLLKTAEDTSWTPSNIKDGRFGKWLEGARDWAISRNRYWGAPVPIWVNDADESDYIVIESIEELQKLAPAAKDLTDLHRPFIDDVIIEQDGKTYRRVEEVIDCWFESGSMPIAQNHYPFENKAKFESSFPADYIGEGLDQTRLWFYVLHVIATILFDKPAYKHVLVNGMIMAADGQKLSKRLKNYPPLDDVFADEGADSLRFYLLSNAPALNAEYPRFERSALKDINRNLFMTLFNSASFLCMYAEIDGWQPASLDKPANLTNPLDKWLLARVEQTIALTTEAAENFELARASWPIYELVDDLSNWYIRRSRRRFWKSEDDSDKLQAYDTLHYSLVTICKLLAPFSPFASDYLYKQLTIDLKAAPISVHLSDWPDVSKVEDSILEQMKVVRQVVNDGLAARAEASIKVRQPLASATVFTKEKLSDELKSIIAEELNTKKIVVKTATELQVQLDTKITQTLKNEGLAREVIRNIQQARKEAALEVENRISLNLQTTDDNLQSAISEFLELIKNEVLATKISLNEANYSFNKSVTIESMDLGISLEKI
jgi:isoleucyl-tRNA synthetase